MAFEFGVEAGQRVIDACAGAGGKSLHMASLMQNKGKVIALDVLEKKLDSLRERSTRAGATIIETRLIESTKVIKRLAESSDRVLLDVPCSGMGVLRRNPDAKWKLTPEEITHLNNLQAEILSGYSKMCRPGATLMYATCSMMPSENLKQVEKFLSQNDSRFSLEKEETLWPEVGGPDGFYFARLKRS
jgi:16S rRNA (cytosine967-C5)-methyltransferase